MAVAQNVFLKKNSVSESLVHERNQKSSRGTESLGSQPEKKHIKEAFGLQNSFDDLSVTADTDGVLSIAVTSQKEYHSPTLDSSRKRLRTSRTKRVRGHFGDLIFNSSSVRNSAFAYRTKAKLSENRTLSEFRNITEKRLSMRQKEATPLLTVTGDRNRLRFLRSKDRKTNEEKEETGALEQKLIKSADYENRFLRKLRIFRQKSLSEAAAPESRVLFPVPHMDQKEEPSEDPPQDPVSDNRLDE